MQAAGRGTVDQDRSAKILAELAPLTGLADAAAGSSAPSPRLGTGGRR